MKLLFLSLLFLACAGALNILSIFPYHGKSHFNVFKVILQELVRKGHNVTVISYFPETSPSKNHHDISLDGSMNIIENNVEPSDRQYLLILYIGLYIFKTGVQNCDVVMANDKVQKLIKDKPKFDVVIMEQFNSDCGLGIAYKLEAPVVALTSYHVLMPFHFQRYGIPDNPAYVSNHFLEGGTKPTLYQKFERFIIDSYFKIGYSWYTQRENQNTLSNYFNDIPPLEDLAKDIKFLLLYDNFALTGSKLLSANVIGVGGYHVTKAKPLEGDLKSFVEGAKHGIVYISFGTVVKSSYLSGEKVRAILDAITEFPQRFIWKWDDETLLVNKNKIHVANWLPQVDILANPKTLAFFSHAGMGGTTEAIHFGVPMIAMPIFGDQPSNAAAIEESGFGVQLHYRDFNKENIVQALKKVLDTEFQSKAKRLSVAWHDRPVPPLDEAVFWIEFAARHSNFTFRTAAADVPLYQYLNLDLICVSLFVLVGMFYSLSVCLKSLSAGTSRDRKTKQK